MKRIGFLLFVFLLLNMNRAMSIDIFADRYIILEYREIFANSQSFSLKVYGNEFELEFLVDKSEKVPTVKQDSIISFDSLIQLIQLHPSKSLSVNVFIKDKEGYIKYSCPYFDAFKLNKDRIYIFQNGKWQIEADFSLGVSKDQNCGHGIVPDQEKLILTEITKEYGNNLYAFKKCIPTSWLYYLVWYVKGFGRIQIEYPTEGTNYKLVKINNQSLEEYFRGRY